MILYIVRAHTYIYAHTKSADFAIAHLRVRTLALVPQSQQTTMKPTPI